MKVGIIGAGTVGSTIGIKLNQQGYPIAAIASKTMAKAEKLAHRVGSKVTTPEEVIKSSELVLIATPDKVIEPLVRELADLFHPGQTVVHFSGSLSSQILSPAATKGAKLLSLHPLQTFASVEVALKVLDGTHFAIEGDNLELGTALVKKLGGIPHCFQGEQKAIYHAGACVASNYLVVLAKLAVNLLVEAGFKENEALQSLLPLMKGTLTNLEEIGLPGALTGPIARGDYPVVQTHLNKMPAQFKDLYCELGGWAVDIGVEKGTLETDSKDKLLQVLNINKETGEE